MPSGYVRQSAGQIVTGNTIQASDFNNEYNALANFADAVVGHDHSGGSGLGPLIPLSTSVTGVLPVAKGGTGIANGTNNSITFTGNFTLGLTLTGNTSVTFPTSGTLLTTGVTSLPSLATVGTITVGVWNGTLVAGQYGGTGVANTGKTITLGGSISTASTFTTSGANALTLTTTGSTNITLPTTGTLVTTANNLSVFAATTSSQLAGIISDETGSGVLVFATSPTLVTPVLGVAAVTSINKVAITAPATSAILTIADGKTLTVNSSITLAGTDSKTLTLSNSLTLVGIDSTTITFQGTDTYVGRATTDTLTNKTFDTAGTGNSFKINGTAITANTGTGSNVLSISPTFTGSPVLPSGTTGTTQAASDNSTKLATTAYVDAAVVGGAKVTIGSLVTQNPYTLGTVTAGAHGLASKPNSVLFLLICLSAEGGYSIGDQIILGGSNLGINATDTVLTVVSDATNLTIITNATQVVQISHKSTAANFNITAGSWKLVATPLLIA